jgi:succinate dehydrogenase/fumarate reductase cytochrome b subunit
MAAVATMSTKPRPISPHVTIYKFPVPAISSILHRYVCEPAFCLCVFVCACVFLLFVCVVVSVRRFRRPSFTFTFNNGGVRVNRRGVCDVCMCTYVLTVLL